MIIEERLSTGSTAIVALPADVASFHSAPRVGGAPHHGRHRRTILRLHQIGACHYHEPVTEEDSSHQIGVGRRIDADHEVETLLDHVHFAILGRHFQTDLGIGAREPRGQLAHRGLREEERRTDAHPASRPVPPRCDRGGGFVEVGEQLRRPLMKRPTLLGELQHPPAALEKAKVEPSLQFGDAARQRRLGAGRGTGGAAEAAMLGHEVEVGEGEQVHPYHQ